MTIRYRGRPHYKNIRVQKVKAPKKTSSSYVRLIMALLVLLLLIVFFLLAPNQAMLTALIELLKSIIEEKTVKK